MKACVFLDRDGTLIEDKHYLHDPQEIVLLPTVIEGLQLLQQAGFCLVMVSNQSGVGRGYFTQQQLDAVQAELCRRFAENTIHFQGLYTCPHSPEAACSCRKPATGMAFAAQKDLDICMEHSFMVGDKADDLYFAQALHIPGLLVRSGKGPATETAHPGLASYVANTFMEAARWIVNNKKNR